MFSPLPIFHQNKSTEVFSPSPILLEYQESQSKIEEIPATQNSETTLKTKREDLDEKKRSKKIKNKFVLPVKYYTEFLRLIELHIPDDHQVAGMDNLKKIYSDKV